MTREEFIGSCVRIGYCSKNFAKKYAKERTTFTDDDFVEVYRLTERQKDAMTRDRDKGLRRIGKYAHTTKRYTVYNGHDES